jgi:deoxyribodipyrimidine photo-lyase
LIRRDFYHQILHHHPHVAHRSFHRQYDAIRWEQGRLARQHYTAWCEGRTGYPLVDAAMAQISQTGYMHHRPRVLVAGFLVDQLGTDWRWGERYFAGHLNDQRVAGTGCDTSQARILDPVEQSRKLDPGGKFIRRYLPQISPLPDAWIHTPWLPPSSDLTAAGVKLGSDYPRPMVEQHVARLRAMDRYAAVKVQRR